MIGAITATGELLARQALAKETIHIAVLYPKAMGRQETFRHFFSALKEAGFVEGQNLRVDFRAAEADPTLLPSLAAELIASRPTAIIGFGSPAIQALHSQTRTIPIVMTNVSDPVGSGFVQSLNNPGANITGVADFNDVLLSKRLELIRDLLPNVQRIIGLWDQRRVQNPNIRRIRQNVVDIAAKMAVAFEPVVVSSVDDIRHAVEAARAIAPIDAALIGADSLFLSKEVPELLTAMRMPTVFSFRQSVFDGGFASVSADVSEQGERLAAVILKIFAGVPTASIPVEQPTKFHVAINLKTAAAMMLNVPQTLTARADEVIE
ncbi:MAG: ABC transporter substrate-binding protein [Beijerinckiaceae bacterium]|nr:ABC transporter substrate-binding protein [Beijerinckiaceae bacterium]